MAESEKVRKRKQQRRENRTKVRQALFMIDYVRHKYYDIYSEAARVYNELNEKHPTKYDLRKAEDFKVWKMQVTAQAQSNRRNCVKPSHPQAQSNSRNCVKPSHPNIQSPIKIHPEAEITIIYNENQPLSPEQSEQSTPYEDPASNPEQSEPQTPHEDPASNPEQSEPQTPHEDPASSPEQSEPQTPYEGPASNPKTPYVDNMQLRIPLLKSSAKRPTVTTKTLQIITEEVLQEDTTIKPSLCEEIDPEVLEKILNELRTDPDLQNIFTDIEQQVEFEQLGMDIDIPEDNMLERELENLEIW